MLQNKSVFLAGVYSFLLSIFIAFISSPLFSFFYDKILNPPRVGYGLFYGRGEELVIGGIIFAYLFFLPLFIILLMPRKQWLVWLILIFIPFTMVLVGGRKHLLWFIIFTLTGGLLGWLVKLAARKLKK